MKMLRTGGVFLLFLCLVAKAQHGHTGIRGSVVDPTGVVIPGAKVVAHQEGSRDVIAKTDASGRVKLNVSSGLWDVTASYPGFEDRLNSGVNVVQDSTTEVTFKLNLRACTYCITVQPNGTKAAVPTQHIEPQPSDLSQSPAESKHFVVQTVQSNPLAVDQCAMTGPNCGHCGLEPCSPVAQAAKANWEYGVLFQGGPGLEERTDFSFIMAGAHLGKVITPELGTGLFKGNFEYAVEVLPLWQSYTPKFQRLNCPAGATLASQCRQTTTGGTYRGASITPIMLRWNLTHGTRFMPWVQAAGGVLYTTRKYPGVGDLNPLDSTQTGPAADTSVWNFTPQGGVGAHYFIKPKRSVDMSVNAVHISSASLGDKNPGVNISLQMSIGYSWWK